MRDRWCVFRAQLPSTEAWSITWVWNTLLTLHQCAARDRRLAGATEDEQLHRRLMGARAATRRRRDRPARAGDPRVVPRRPLPEGETRGAREHSFKQARRGRPVHDTAYRRITRRRFDIEYSIGRDAVAYDEKSDGMYPLLTNDRNLTAAQVLEDHKGQPTIERRFEQVDTVHEIAPVFLKNEGRIEALFTLYFLALPVQVLIERELRLAMQHEMIDEPPLYPEHRQCWRLTTEVLRLFSIAQRHRLTQVGETVQLFEADLTDLQRKILRLPGVSETVYRART